MLGRLAPTALSIFTAVGLSSAIHSQQCPDTCPVTFQVSSSGAFRPGDIVTVVPTATSPATSALLGVIGGGFVCKTCTPCSADFVVSWTIVTSACVSYGVCGLLQNGPGSGSVGGTLTRNCNAAPLSFVLDYGLCNLGGPCPPPIVSPVSWTATATLTCGNCQ